MAQGFLTGVDIANRGLQHIGARRIVTFQDATRNAAESLSIYDKIRRHELRRSVWNFACRRATMRTITATSVIVVPNAWLVGTTYGVWSIVADTAGQLWQSLITGNIGNPPVESSFWTAYAGPVVADNWSGSVNYFPGDIVLSGGNVYIALNALPNLNHVPPNVTYWVPFVSGVAWTPLPTTLLPGPYAISADFLTFRNVYKLPAGFLRIAPQDQKRADRSRLSVSAEMRYRDWEIENGFIFTTETTSPFVLRYVADITNVTLMDDLFCEAMAASMGSELCEILTQNRDKLGATRAAYDAAIQLAKDINAVEAGSTENEEDPDVRVAPVPANQPARGQQ
jgi:hypothetical protein